MISEQLLKISINAMKSWQESGRPIVGKSTWNKDFQFVVVANGGVK